MVNNCQMLALCLLRMIVGFTFLAHGCQKVFGLFGGSGLVGFGEWIASMGLPAWLGYLAALFEFFGGTMMLFGVATELGALMTIPVMIVAIIMVHPSAYFLQKDGCEYALNLALLAVAIIIGGPGSYALWDPFLVWRQ